ncbi:1-(5-phosphoribosyl)-5-[(5-phosphoribosylamino) methylideneamino] imidazole-4-carboxamide isomerase [archaeon HR06]|nr:1-(5-phosphoribosyl)-5-[(5-phosphoribosylamino) methylideneamino] imidazole-4-carboxamide isomerase [archaeon HR06]
MKIIPSLDLLDGEVVRLIKGNFEKRIIYSKDPLKILRSFEEKGIDTLHVVDLNSALGKGDNLSLIERIIREARISIQVGGGIRSFSLAERLIKLGAKRIVLGTLPFENFEEFNLILKTFTKDKVILALDYFHEEVLIRGWKESTRVKLFDAIERFKALGVDTFLLTSIDRDGTLKGLDFEVLSKVSKKDIKVLASGGIKGYEDIIELKKLNIYGVIIGRAIYDGLISLDKVKEIVS